MMANGRTVNCLPFWACRRYEDPSADLTIDDKGGVEKDRRKLGDIDDPAWYELMHDRKA